MRTTRRPTLVAGTVVLWLTTASALAQSVEYRFVTADIPIPQSAGGGIAIPADINDQGLIVTTVVPRSTFVSEALFAQPAKKGTFDTALFACGLGDTTAYSVNDKADAAGACGASGIVFDGAGHQLLLNVPGAVSTIAFGIGTRGQIVGQYFNPHDFTRSGLYDIHGFMWRKGTFTTIDFPVGDTFTRPVSVNVRGQILGEFFRFDPTTNATLEHNWFIYDNGQFALPFPPSLEWEGGPAVYVADMNDAGQAVGQRYNGGPAWNGLFLFDNGQFFDIPVPASFAFIDVRGMNNEGQFVGLYAVQAGIDPETGAPIFAFHGYIASPVTQP